MPGGNEISLNQTDVRALFPAIAPPKLLSIRIVVVEKDIAFHDAQLPQLCQAFFDQFRAEPLTAVSWYNCEMMQVTPAAIMAAENCADKVSSVAGDKAHSGISFEVGGNSFACV